MFDKLKKMAQRYLPAWMAKIARYLATYIRYFLRKRKAKSNFNDLGKRYKQHVIFVAGLPKSGTTWVEKMLGSFQGYQEMMIPEAVFHESDHKGSHFFDIPEDTFSRFSRSLLLMKLHVHGSLHNIDILRKSDLHYLVVFRDLRDVAISHYHYVRQTSWHPEYKSYINLTLKEGLLYFSKTLLPDYVQWVNSWHENIDPEKGLIITYENLLADPHKEFTKICQHFELSNDLDEIHKIVDQNSFKKLKSKESDLGSEKDNFFRKGIAGDWVNYFDDEITQAFIENSGNFFVKYGYEDSINWRWNEK